MSHAGARPGRRKRLPLKVFSPVCRGRFMTTDEPGVTFATDELAAWVQRVLQRYGMFAVEAELLIARLFEAETRGRSQEGLRKLQEIVTAFEMGDIDPRARTLKGIDLPAFATLDGSTGVGQVGASRAMQLAIDKAQTAGIALVVVRNSQPCGDVRVIAELAARAGCVGFCSTNSGKAIFPGDEQGNWLSTHPQAWALPGTSSAGWVASRELSAAEFPFSERGTAGLWHGVISLALTAGLTSSRLPGVKKKSSPYGAGAEHCCLALNLATMQTEQNWESWTSATLPLAAPGWKPVEWSPLPETITLASTTHIDLQDAAKQSRNPLPAERTPAGDA
ncbi:MAG: hypothetical protein B7Z55_01665 [Planctomycetales bacterium 12-60-4]|nr:MAG: hypothetical protein B7Z55_01665 [Planctomycetales bacterium 12-60-4]